MEWQVHFTVTLGSIRVSFFFLVLIVINKLFSRKAVVYPYSHSNFVHQTIFNVATSATQMKGSPGTGYI